MLGALTIAAIFSYGFDVQVVLLQSLAYIIDMCLTNANSAISGTVILRSLDANW